MSNNDTKKCDCTKCDNTVMAHHTYCGPCGAAKNIPNHPGCKH